MIKICTICLREIETNARNFKYCENCRAGSYRFLVRRWRAQHPNYMRDYYRKNRTIKVAKQQERLQLERQQIIAKLFERRARQK